MLYCTYVYTVLLYCRTWREQFHNTFLHSITPVLLYTSPHNTVIMLLLFVYFTINNSTWIVADQMWAVLAWPGGQAFRCREGHHSGHHSLQGLRRLWCQGLDCAVCDLVCIHTWHGTYSVTCYPIYTHSSFEMKGLLWITFCIFICTCILQSSDCPHKLTHFLYTSRPDHGVPLHPSSLVKFAQEVRKVCGNSRAPMVLHCRWGNIYTLSFACYCTDTCIIYYR